MKPHTLNTNIRIRVVTDERTLKSKGHDLPVIELFNDVIDTWVSIGDLSFDTIKRELAHIDHVTEVYMSKNFPKQNTQKE